MKTIKELRLQTEMSQSQFANYFNIPLASIQNWEQERTKCNDYLIDLIQFKIKKEIENMKTYNNKEQYEQFKKEGKPAIITIRADYGDISYITDDTQTTETVEELAIIAGQEISSGCNYLLKPRLLDDTRGQYIYILE